MPVLYIVRGLPGSGKSTLAKKLVGDFYQKEADQYFMKDGEYNFDPSLLSKAHEWCRFEIQRFLKHGKDCAVSNTFTRIWEMQAYLDLAKKYCFDVQVITCVGDPKWKNVHGVPNESIEKMKKRWEDYCG